MRAYLLVFAASVLLVLRGCNSAAPEYVPTGTVRDLMDSFVDPSADFIWKSISTVITRTGTETKFPRTDEEWKEVRNRAIALVAVTNLLLVPNRHVARPGEKSANPGDEREPEEIEAMIKNDRAIFESRVGGLRDAAMKALSAIESKDLNALGRRSAVSRMLAKNAIKFTGTGKDKAAAPLHPQVSTKGGTTSESLAPNHHHCYFASRAVEFGPT
jgi:hypothetical protein